MRLRASPLARRTDELAALLHLYTEVRKVIDDDPWMSGNPTLRYAVEDARSTLKDAGLLREVSHGSR